MSVTSKIQKLFGLETKGALATPAREAIYLAGADVVKQRQGLFAHKAYDLRLALRPYNKSIAEHDVILDAVIGEHWAEFYDQPEAWQQGADGESFGEWMQGLEDCKVGQLNAVHARRKTLNVVVASNDLDEIPDTWPRISLQ